MSYLKLNYDAIHWVGRELRSCLPTALREILKDQQTNETQSFKMQENSLWFQFYFKLVFIHKKMSKSLLLMFFFIFTKSLFLIVRKSAKVNERNLIFSYILMFPSFISSFMFSFCCNLIFDVDCKLLHFFINRFLFNRKTCSSIKSNLVSIDFCLVFHVLHLLHSCLITKI